MLLVCNICPRRCNVNRDSNTGFCGSGNQIRIARAMPHYWEEPCISGTNGSGAVFFSGCSLKCVFCQNYEVSHNCYGVPVTEDKLIRVFESLLEKGVHNINLVTPTHYSLQIAKALERFDSPVPVIWNSSGYESTETLKMLEGLIDVYLPDIKYYDDAISMKYSGADNYFVTAFNAAKEMFRQVGLLETDKNGIAVKGIIIRHLVLPGNISQTIKIFNAVADYFPPEISISIMRQYTPFGKAEQMPPLDRRLSSREYSIVKGKILDMGFENIYYQKSESADKQYIPDFNLEGIDLGD